MSPRSYLSRAPLPANHHGFDDVLVQDGRVGPGVPIDEIAALNEVDAHTADDLGHLESPFQLSYRGEANVARLAVPPVADDFDLRTELALEKLERILAPGTFEMEPPTPRALEVLSRLTAVVQAHVLLRHETEAVGEAALDWR